MKSQSSAPSITTAGRRFGLLALFFVLSLTFATSVSAQKKKKKDDTPPPQNSSDIVSLPDQAKIDNAIGQMLAAWQVGDLEKLHSTVADDVSVVSGTWAPPVIGWANYSAAYQLQRARLQQVRMERSNTLIRIAPNGNFAWACYQWEFTGVVDGAPSSSVGQTSLVLEKRGDTWVIVHNHTSLPPGAQQPAPANTPATQQTPARPSGR